MFGRKPYGRITTGAGGHSFLLSVLLLFCACVFLLRLLAGAGAPPLAAPPLRAAAAAHPASLAGSSPPPPVAPDFTSGPAPPLPYHGPTGLPSGLLLAGSAAEAMRARVAAGGAGVAPAWTLTPRQLCDLELLLNDGFSPLRGFMERDEYDSVLARMRLGAAHGGALWPLPVTLDVPAGVAAALSPGALLPLRDDHFNLLAVLEVGAGGPWAPDRAAEAAAAFGTVDPSHPGAAHLLGGGAHAWYVGGSVHGLRLPPHYDFPGLRRTPAEVRALAAGAGWKRMVAFQTRNPMHRAHVEVTRLAAARARAGLLLHPVVGVTKAGDVDAPTRVRAIASLLPGSEARRAPGAAAYYAPGAVALSLLPLAMRMGGPREALLHAIVRKNYGATHFIVGRDHAGAKDGRGRDFYGPRDAAALALAHEAELGIAIVAVDEVSYVPARDAYVPAGEVRPGEATRALSGTAVRAALASGAPIPAWFSDPAVVAILRASGPPPPAARGVAVFFTGLSGSGKSTLAGALAARLAALAPRRALTLLDGDAVRARLGGGLGFSLPDRAAAVERLGWVAGEVARAGGTAVAAPIAPAAAPRRAAADAVRAAGGAALLVHAAAPLAACAARDVKGLYRAAARAFSGGGGGVLDLPALAAGGDVTGLTAPYELPTGGAAYAAHVTLDTANCAVEEGVAALIGALAAEGFIELPAEVATAEEGALAAALRDGWDAPSVAAAAGARGARPLSPCVARALASAADLQALFTGAQADPGARLCVADADAAGPPGAPRVLHGGLPAAGSPAAAALRAAAAQGAGIPPGGAPLRVALLLAPHARALRALTAAAEAEGTPWALLADARVDAAEAAGGAEAARAPGAPPPNPDAPLPPADALPPLFARRGAAHPAATPPRAAPPAATLFAAYDLWAGARWAAHYAPSELAAATGAAAGAGRLAVAHPRLAQLAEHVLRLDPCATARVALPALGGEGTRPARAVDQPPLAAALAAELAGEGAHAQGEQAARAAAQAFVAAVLNAAERFPARVQVVYY
jgi:sulfate adenylyltransferase